MRKTWLLTIILTAFVTTGGCLGENPSDDPAPKENATTDVSGGNATTTSELSTPIAGRTIENQTFPVYYEYGYATVDTSTSRLGITPPTCGPCTFNLKLDELPDFLVFEAVWDRNFMPPAGASDEMYHILRAGAPFASGVTIGADAMGQPFQFIYPKDALNPQNASRQPDGTYAFSGSVYCAGNAPCRDQSIDAWLSFLYGYDEVPEGYTALPPS